MNALVLYRSKIREIDIQHRGDLEVVVCEKGYFGWISEELDEEENNKSGYRCIVKGKD